MEMKSIFLFGIFILVAAFQNIVQGSPPRLGVHDVHSHKHTAIDLSTVHFYLWTKSNPGDSDYYEVVTGDLASLEASPLDPSLTTYFIVHGWNNNGLTGWVLEAKTNILALGASNVFSVDWGDIADNVDYYAVADHVFDVAAYLGQFIDFLVINGEITTSNIEMTGHSLGAHCCGISTESVTTGRISRITGLDPAGPQFYTSFAKNRLDKSQADFVDVIHTNGGLDITGCNGLDKEIGHVDFYPNGGSHQPGCIADVDGCSHNRSHALWIESMKNSTTDLPFTSWPCNTWKAFEKGNCPDCGQGCLNMGFFVQRSLEGIYYLSTEKNSPYAMGDIQV